MEIPYRLSYAIEEMTPWRQSSSEKSVLTEMNKMTDPQATPKVISSTAYEVCQKP